MNLLENEEELIEEENRYIYIEKQQRSKSWILWISVFSVFWHIFNLIKGTTIDNITIKDILNYVSFIIIMFGIYNNPTDKNNL